MCGHVLDHVMHPFLDKADVSWQPFAMSGDLECFGNIAILSQGSCGEGGVRRELPSWRWVLGGCHFDWCGSKRLKILRY